MLCHRIKTSNKSDLKNPQDRLVEMRGMSHKIGKDVLNGSWFAIFTDPDIQGRSEFVLDMSQVFPKKLKYSWIYNLGRSCKIRSMMIGFSENEISYIDHVVYYSRPLSEAEESWFRLDPDSPDFVSIKIERYENR